MPLLNKRQLMIAIPVWIILAAFAWFYPIHNLMNPKFVPLSAAELVPFTNFDNKTIVVYPILTGYAYSKHGFYEYYNKTCDQSCLTVSIHQNGTSWEKLKTDIGSVYWIHPQEETSNSAYRMLHNLNFHFITDIDIDKNPDILIKYDKVILLHNEYMTEKEWNAIKYKQHVIYLYPNAAYAEVSVNYTKGTMTLIKGHGYKDVDNAFDSGTTSKGEYDLNCIHPYWSSLPNGIEYSCYPELDILNNLNLIKVLDEWPNDTGFNTTLGLKNP